MITNNIKETIRAYFFTNPGSKLRVRQIEKTLKLPLPSVIRYCKDLEKEGILTITKTGDVTFYTSNRANDGFLFEKKLFNLREIHASGFIDLLRNELSNPTIILFGSYSKGEDMENSDIDLYIETPSKKSINLEKFEKILQRKIQIFRYKNIRDVENVNLANNIINGILLNGFIEVFR